jgi:hypothetical protein
VPWKKIGTSSFDVSANIRGSRKDCSSINLTADQMGEMGAHYARDEQVVRTSLREMQAGFPVRIEPNDLRLDPIGSDRAFYPYRQGRREKDCRFSDHQRAVAADVHQCRPYPSAAFRRLEPDGRPIFHHCAASCGPTFVEIPRHRRP